jgi:hypothetical protein
MVIGGFNLNKIFRILKWIFWLFPVTLIMAWIGIITAEPRDWVIGDPIAEGMEITLRWMFYIFLGVLSFAWLFALRIYLKILILEKKKDHE